MLLIESNMDNLNLDECKPIKEVKSSKIWTKLNLNISPGTPASSTTKTGCHNIAEILLKVALKHQKSIKSIIII
jgi:hypothetical protein